MAKIVRRRSVTAWPEFDPRPAHTKFVVEKGRWDNSYI